MDNVDSNIDISSPKVSDTITANIAIIADTKRLPVDMNDATTNLSAELSDDGFTIEKADSIFPFLKNSLLAIILCEHLLKL